MRYRQSVARRGKGSALPYSGRKRRWINTSAVTPENRSTWAAIASVTSYTSSSNAAVDIAATAWMVPQKLMSGETQFAVIPWTRVAAAEAHDIPLLLLAGSGCEEVAIVLRTGLEPKDVKKVAVPVRGGSLYRAEKAAELGAYPHWPRCSSL